MTQTRGTTLWWLSFITMCFTAYWLQINSYLHKDVAIISHTAAQMLQGHTYAHDIFEPNPPIIFYLHFIPIFLSKISGIKIIYTLRLILIALCALSIIISRIFLNKLCLKFTNAMSYGIASILLFLPAEAFGQREHFFLILTLPYLLLTACRLQQYPTTRSTALWVGILAGIGFAIKPFFLCTLVCVEWVFLQHLNSNIRWLRLEFVVIIAFLSLYIVSIVLFYPTYWQIVLPLWMPYYRGIRGSWFDVLSNPLFLWSCAAVCLNLFTQTTKTTLKQVLIAGTVGNLLVYLIPQVTWYYHILPAVALASLYFIACIAELNQAEPYSSANHQPYRFVWLIGLVLFVLPMGQAGYRMTQTIAYFHSTHPEQKLMQLLATHSKPNHYMFLSMTHNLYDLEFYAPLYNVGSFSFCSWEYLRLGQYSAAYKSKILTYVLDILAHDLNDKKPQFIILDRPSSSAYLKQWIDYPNEYSQNPIFQKAWAQYTYLTTIAPYDIYQRF